MMNRAKIEDVLLAIGIPAGTKGFIYIADAVEIINKRGVNIGITKELYPSVAKRNKTTWTRVERNIRHAFETARNLRSNYEIVDHYIGFSNCKNSASLKQLYMMLKREETEV